MQDSPVGRELNTLEISTLTISHWIWLWFSLDIQMISWKLIWKLMQNLFSFSQTLFAISVQPVAYKKRHPHTVLVLFVILYSPGKSYLVCDWRSSSCFVCLRSSVGEWDEYWCYEGELLLCDSSLLEMDCFQRIRQDVPGLLCDVFNKMNHTFQNCNRELGRIRSRPPLSHMPSTTL